MSRAMRKQGMKMPVLHSGRGQVWCLLLVQFYVTWLEQEVAT